MVSIALVLLELLVLLVPRALLAPLPQQAPLPQLQPRRVCNFGLLVPLAPLPA